MLSSLVLAVNRGDAWGWSSPAILGLFVASGSLLIAFILVERRSLSPVVDLALFKLRSYTASISAATLQFFGLSAVIILGPFYLVDARGFSTLEAGAILAAFPIAMLVISPFSGALSDRVGARLPSTCGLALACGALLFTATLDTDSSVAGIVVRLFLVGAGTALFDERAAMACTVAVEEVIDEHYAEQIEALEDAGDETDLKQRLERFRADEIEHRDTGLAHGARQAPGYEPLTAFVKAGSRLAIWLSERI